MFWSCHNLIKYFSSQKIFNPIRDDGPEEHIVKKIGTPTNKISKPKKGSVLRSNLQINDLIENNFDNDDFLMIKASNATGFNKIVKELKGTN